MKPLKHIAIIMDGNGRWGLKKKKNRNFGHKQGLNVIENIINFVLDSELKILTLFAFSTENWKRPQKEIDYLFSLLEFFLENKLEKLNKKKISIKFIGNKKRIKKSLVKKMSNAEKITQFNNKLKINIALNYGSRDEIINSVNILKKKKLKLNIKNLEDNLYTKKLPDPDILIRTGNTNRLSNFMLWQIAYTEIFFEKKLWPDFTINDLKRIINAYQKIHRKFGGLNA
jgi:undecaprenyl diphosphate synthase